VSTPTVARMVQKMGYSGFPDFQASLRDELGARISSPIEKRDAWSHDAPQSHILNRFADATLANIRKTLADVDPSEFDAITRLLSDSAHRVFITGGRITHALSHYLELHLQVIRPGVGHIQPTASGWSHALLDMNEGDVLVIYDIRRYENNALALARMAEEKGVKIILFTDQWQSPVHPHASHSLAARIEAPSAWDSTAALLLLTETLIAAVQEALWDTTRERMAELEDIFDRSKVFRKFL
jgi:DNA-binding MurR/RpiR family transcriptional regulator